MEKMGPTFCTITFASYVIWLFIDSIRNEVNTVHDLITQIHSGM